RINTSNVLSELVYSLSNLLVLFNDHIIHNTRRREAVGSGEKLKMWLTVLDYSEVFIEVSARRLWGEKGKWLIVVAVQIFKCAGRLLLLFHHNENIIQSPSLPPLRRKKLDDDARTEESRIRLHSASFTLKRSGRIIRSVNAGKHIKNTLTTMLLKLKLDQTCLSVCLDGRTIINNVFQVLYVVKPVAHLCSMLLFGQKDWKPWLLSLAVDLSSLQLYKSQRTGQTLSRRQRLELSRRTITLLLYLLRSPFYEQHSSDRLQALLHRLARDPRYGCYLGYVCLESSNTGLSKTVNFVSRSRRFSQASPKREAEYGSVSTLSGLGTFFCDLAHKFIAGLIFLCLVLYNHSSIQSRMAYSLMTTGVDARIRQAQIYNQSFRSFAYIGWLPSNRHISLWFRAQDGDVSESVPTNADRRRVSSGLISMPRVGRPDLTWTFQSQGDTVLTNKNKKGLSSFIKVPRVGREFLTLAPGVHTDAYQKGKRGSSGLIPMPRVGRSDLTWSLTDGLLDSDGAMMDVPVKRFGGSSEEVSGMWFGPRLGKRSKRSVDSPWTLFTVREIPAAIRDYASLLGRESEEEDCADMLDEDSATQIGRAAHIHQ
ncbi:hypothetical protein Cfor_08149, partial [Coptotermes formosanus]